MAEYEWRTAVGCVICAFQLAFLTGGLVYAAATPVTDGPPETVEQALGRHGVSLSRDSLLAALHAANPEVRELAAQKLSFDNDKTAIPFIQDAMAHEVSAINRINIALFLAQMGVKEGAEALVKSCSDTGLAGALRALAARNTLELGSRACWAEVVSIARNDRDPSAVDIAFSLLSQYAGESKHDLATILDIASRRLNSESGMIRLAASHVLGVFGDLSAIGILESAVGRESDATIRSQMEKDLDTLQTKAKK